MFYETENGKNWFNFRKDVGHILDIKILKFKCTFNVFSFPVHITLKATRRV